MYRFLFLFLLCLLLSGCGINAPAPELPGAGTQFEETAPAISAGSRVSCKELEGTGQDPLEVYSLESSNVTGLRAMGDELLVFSGSDTTSLTILSGSSLTSRAFLSLDFPLEPGDPSLRLNAEGLSYFDPVRRETVILNTSLSEVSRIPAPDNLQGIPILSDDRNTLYYCTPNAVRAWDLSSGLRRQVKEMAFPSQALTGLSLDGSVLTCRIQEGSQVRTMLLSSQTGRLLFEQNGEMDFSGENGWYYASLSSGLGQTLIFGSTSGDPQLFLPADASAACFFLEHRMGAVTAATHAEVQKLDYYDLSSGLRTASLTLGSGSAPLALTAGEDGKLSILIYDPEYGCHMLCRWEPGGSASAVQDDRVYTFSYHRDEDPEGLARCRAYAGSLGEKYGIEILVGAEAVHVQPWDYDLEPEPQTAIIQRELELLEQRLANFPGSILPDTASHFTSLKLCIVRQLTGTAESGSLAQTPQLQFYHGTDAYVVIAAGRYSEQALYHGLCQVMETRIFTESTALDQWEKLNPPEFSYTYGLTYAQDTLGAYLEGEDRVFANASSMGFPKEDRASILEYAMLPGNQAFFRPWRMQRKLQTLCRGIREAYGLEESPESYLWEQYLDASLAYQPK